MAIGNVTVQAVSGNVIGVIAASGDGVYFPTVLYRYANLTLPYSPQDPGLTFQYDNSSLAPVVLLFARFFNLLNESSISPLVVNVGTTAFVVSGGPSFSGGNCLDVRAFGAVGDGVTDDTAAIQKALNQAALNYQGNLQAQAKAAAGVSSQLVQFGSAAIQNGSGNSVAVVLANQTVSGNTLLVTVVAFNYGAAPVVSDGGDIFALDGQVANGQEIHYLYRAPVTHPAAATIVVTVANRNFNSNLVAIAGEWTGLLQPIVVDGFVSKIEPNSNVFTPVTLNSTNQPDLVISSVRTDFAAGIPPTVPSGFSLVTYVPTLQPNGLNGAVPVTVVAFQNWVGSPAVSPLWGNPTPSNASYFGGTTFLAAYRRVSGPAASSGITTVCIPPGVNCLVNPVALDWQKLAPQAGNTRVGPGRLNYACAYSLVMSDGVTLEIDGSLIANPFVTRVNPPISGGVFGKPPGQLILGSFDVGWFLLTNSSWLLNSTMMGSLQFKNLGSFDTDFPVVFSDYLAGLAFNEGPRNSNIKVTGTGRVLLNANSIAISGTLSSNTPSLWSYQPVGLARFFCVDSSTIENLEIINPLWAVIEWGHSNAAVIENLYIHDGWYESVPPSTFPETPGFPAVFALPMLRNSTVQGNTILNCPIQVGILDGAGYQLSILDNVISNCFGGYVYVDIDIEFGWTFSLTPGVFGSGPPPPDAAVYGVVPHNSLIHGNRVSGCVTGVLGQAVSPPFSNPVGSGFFPFFYGGVSVAYSFLPGTGGNFAGSDTGATTTGDLFTDNISTGNSEDWAYTKREAFTQATDNTFSSGPAGGVSNGQNQVSGETPTGTVDGTNVTFTLAHIPIASTVALYLNGLLQTLGTDYTISGKTITMAVAPNQGSTLLVNYSYLSGN